MARAVRKTPWSGEQGAMASEKKATKKEIQPGQSDQLVDIWRKGLIYDKGVTTSIKIDKLVRYDYYSHHPFDFKWKNTLKMKIRNNLLVPDVAQGIPFIEVEGTKKFLSTKEEVRKNLAKVKCLLISGAHSTIALQELKREEWATNLSKLTYDKLFTRHVILINGNALNLNEILLLSKDNNKRETDHYKPSFYKILQHARAMWLVKKPRKSLSRTVHPSEWKEFQELLAIVFNVAEHTYIHRLVSSEEITWEAWASVFELNERCELAKLSAPQDLVVVTAPLKGKGKPKMKVKGVERDYEISMNQFKNIAALEDKDLHLLADLILKGQVVWSKTTKVNLPTMPDMASIIRKRSALSKTIKDYVKEKRADLASKTPKEVLEELSIHDDKVDYWAEENKDLMRKLVNPSNTNPTLPLYITEDLDKKLTVKTLVRDDSPFRVYDFSCKEDPWSPKLSLERRPITLAVLDLREESPLSHETVSSLIRRVASAVMPKCKVVIFHDLHSIDVIKKGFLALDASPRFGPLEPAQFLQLDCLVACAFFDKATPLDVNLRFCLTDADNSRPIAWEDTHIGSFHGDVSLNNINALIAEMGKDDYWLSYRCETMLEAGIFVGRRGVLLVDFDRLGVMGAKIEMAMSLNVGPLLKEEDDDEEATDTGEEEVDDEEVTDTGEEEDDEVDTGFIVRFKLESLPGNGGEQPKAEPGIEEGEASKKNEEPITQEDIKAVFEEYGVVRFVHLSGLRTAAVATGAGGLVVKNRLATVEVVQGEDENQQQQHFSKGDTSGLVWYETLEGANKARTAAAATEAGGLVVKDRLAIVEAVQGEDENQQQQQQHTTVTGKHVRLEDDEDNEDEPKPKLQRTA